MPADSLSGWELCIWTSLPFLSYQMLIVFNNYVYERIFIMVLWFRVLRSVWNGVARLHDTSQALFLPDHMHILFYSLSS